MFIYLDRMIIHCLDNHGSVQKRDCPVGGMEAGRELEVLQCLCLGGGGGKKMMNSSRNNGAQEV